MIRENNQGWIRKIDWKMIREGSKKNSLSLSNSREKKSLRS
jgi:hypothetical protein